MDIVSLMELRFSTTEISDWAVGAQATRGKEVKTCFRYQHISPQILTMGDCHGRESEGGVESFAEKHVD